MRDALYLLGSMLSLTLVLNGGAAAEVNQPPISDNRPLKIIGVAPDRALVPRCGKVEISVDLSGTYSNAFDPDEIAVDAEFSAPDGKTAVVPGFYSQDYTRELRGGKELLTRKGGPIWRVRFAPTLPGEYRAVVSVRDSTGANAKSQPVSFKCVASDSPGYIRLSSVDKRYFAFDNGKPYVPIGANVCWGGGRATFDYDDWLPRYSKAGCNYFRVWLGPGWVTFALEHTGQPAERYGVGKFDLANAWRLDYVLDLAAENGQYVMLCLDSYNELRKKAEGGYPFWDDTPHNAARGGPLKEPREFWTNPTMLRLYRNKLRYMVARYGWNPHVMSWEYWNEVDIISSTAYVPDEVKKWHAQMSDYLRGIDPWKHLQTTSFASSKGRPEVDKLPQMDYVQTHNYGSRDVAAALVGFQKSKAAYGKPHYIGEFGTDAGGPDGKVDPDGTALHNGIWSTLLSGSAGSAMLWWWDNFIHPKDMYYHFAALSEFVKGIDFPREDFQRIENAEFRYANPPKSSAYRDVDLGGQPSWDKSPENKPTTVEVSSDGVSAFGPVAGILHGVVNHQDKHNPLTLVLDLPHPTKLHILVAGVSGYGGAHLVADLNTARVLDKDMPDTNPMGKHETLSSYDGEYTVDIPSGKHTLMVENTGKDWMIVHYVLERAERIMRPDLRLRGLRGRDVSLLWVQNSLHTWARTYATRRQPDPQPPSVLSAPGWPKGKYAVRFYDTYAGKETGVKNVNVGENGLRLQLPEISKDIALKVEKVELGVSKKK